MLGRPAVASVVGVVVFLDVSGSGRAREVRQRFAGQVTGHQVESFMSACVDARLLHYVPMLLFDLFRASPCWLAALRGGAFGAEGSLAAVGSIKSGCSSCYADASERAVSPRLEVGGSACFALALRSLSRLRLFLFEARLYGYCVREGEARESTLGS